MAISDLIAQLQAAQTTANALANYISGLESGNVALTSRVDALQAQLDAANKKIADLQAQLGAKDKTLWGSSAGGLTKGETFIQALARVEKALGTLGIVRYYQQAGEGVTWPTDVGSRPMVYSFKWNPGEVVAGKHDAEFKNWCAGAPDHVTYWSLWHEPEDDIARGAFTAADYRSAWSRLSVISRASGKNLVPTLILMRWSLDPRSKRNWQDYFQADAVDVVAWDAYYGNGTTGEEIYGPARDATVAAGKKWAIAETGVSDSVGTATKDSALTALSSWLSQASPKPEFVTYFDSDPGNSRGWPISVHPDAAASWLKGISQ